MSDIYTELRKKLLNNGCVFIDINAQGDELFTFKGKQFAISEVTQRETKVKL